MRLSSGSGAAVLVSKVIIPFTIVSGLLVVITNASQASGNIWGQAAVFAFLSFLAQLMPTRLPQGADFSVSFILDLVLIALYGMTVAVLTRFVVTVTAGLFSRLMGRNDSLFKIVNTSSQAVLVVALAATGYQITGHSVLGFTIASIAYFCAITFFITLDGGPVTGESFAARWFSVVKTIYINFFVLASLSYLLAYIIKNANLEWQFFSLLLFFVPVMLVSHSFRLFINIKQNYLNTVKTVAAAIEAKDPYMKGHSERVAELAIILAKEYGLSQKELQKLEFVALLHDAGKIGISDQILNKTGALSGDEYRKIKEHSALGAEILQKIKFLSNMSDIVLHHHERYDGSGYPAGLRGTDIPLASRILAVADAYDAMTKDRPFRRAKAPLQAIEEMEKLRGVQFDPSLVLLFKTVLQKRGEI